MTFPPSVVRDFGQIVPYLIEIPAYRIGLITQAFGPISLGCTKAISGNFSV